MISAKGMYYNDEKTKLLMQKAENEVPFAIQIFGSDADIMASTVEEVGKHADIIDINMGCPAPKVVKNGDGSKLMLSPDLIDEITKKVVEKSNVPVTIKIRKGWNSEHINAVQIAKIAEKNGVSAITVHGRTREEFYSGKADWDIIKEVKKAVSIPVIGNGDITSIESANEIFQKTNCDAIMIGRASLGNPWIFKEIITGEKIEKSCEDVKNMIIKHLNMLVKEKGEYTAIREMRKHVGWYIKGFANASEIRKKVCEIEEISELKNIIENI
jgi:tRNA-dihydrouridine synthase B